MESNNNGKTSGKPSRRRDKRSDRHIRYQNILASLLREYDFVDVEIEKPMPYTLPSYGGRSPIIIRYRLDVYGRNGDRKIAIEIDGYMGHKSRRAYEMDGLRSRRIQETLGPIDVYRFTFSRLANWTREEIAKEMRLE